MAADPRTTSLNVAVASFRSASTLSDCLDALLASSAVERVVVARPGGAADVAARFGDHPRVEFVETPASASLPLLRALALRGAGVGPVALIEDHCVPAPDWAERISRAEPRATVVGGSVDNRRGGAVTWAAFFAEYGLYGPGRPAAAGAQHLTGANVLYREGARARATGMMADGAWEDVIHSRLAEGGEVLHFEPGATVYQNLEYRFGSFCRDRYVHGRDYARVRSSGLTPVTRLVRLLATPLLPPLLLLRIGRRLPRRHVGAFFRALPTILLFLSAWAFGEAVGYLRGAPPR